MNSFTSSVLSLLLGWLRTLLTGLWRMVSSEGSGAMAAFLRNNWALLVGCLCVGGFVVDRLVYFFRWRPDYVWRSRLARWRNRQPKGQRQPDPAQPARGALAGEAYEEYAYGEAYAPQGYTQPEVPAQEYPTQTYQQPDQAFAPAYQPPTAGPAYDPYPHTAQYAPSYAEPQPYAPMQDFAPAVQPGAAYAYMPEPISPDMQPVFDEPTSTWAPPEPLAYEPTLPYQEPYENPAQGLEPSFGASAPEPPAYHFAPERVYQPHPEPEPTVMQQPVTPEGPVHPGLDLQTFQQNIGLDSASFEEDEWEEGTPFPDPVDFPDTTFVPYYQQAESKEGRRLGALGMLAKKARELVSADDENRQPTIKDLQSNVDMKNAFHPPVLPKSSTESGEE